MRGRAATLAAILLLAGCAVRPDAHAPPFANKPYEPFSRQAAIRIARGQWRYWGKVVFDAQASDELPANAEDTPERRNGFWQQVGLYWWLGMNAGRREDRWTGKHDAAGQVFPPKANGHYAWSAAFISYVMRMAGAGPRFPYSPNHAQYIDYAWRAGHGEVKHPLLLGEDPEIHAPRPGDLICAGRSWAHDIRYDDLPSDGYFPSHCAIVVAVHPQMISVIGGNVDDTVALTHVPVTPAGMLVMPNGTVVDDRYDWFVVLRVLYARG